MFTKKKLKEGKRGERQEKRGKKDKEQNAKKSKKSIKINLGQKKVEKVSVKMHYELSFSAFG